MYLWHNLILYDIIFVTIGTCMNQILPLNIPKEYHEVFIQLALEANRQTLSGEFPTAFIHPKLLNSILSKHHRVNTENILSEEEIAFALSLYP